MNHASLFSGIGAAEIAAEWVGWENLFHCEINPFGRKVLEYWYPNSISYEDITKTDFTEWRGKIDVLTAGFPCQPFSVAGSRKGADDDRYLWPQVVRVIRETRPAWVVGENVAGILTMVQPGEEVEVGSEASLFGEGDAERTSLRQEYVIETVCRDLEREGYSVQPFVIPACAVGAPHRRDRVWIVARRITPDPADTRPESLQCGREDRVHAVGVTSHPDLNRQRERAYQQVSVAGCQGASYDCVGCEDGDASHSDSTRPQERFKAGGQPDETEIATGMDIGVERHGNGRIIADTDSNEFQRECFSQKAKAERWKDENRRFEEYSGKDWATLPADRWRDFPTQSPVRSRDDGFPIPMDGITFSKWRQESIKAYGNAWCIPVAYEIFRAIQQVEDGMP